MILVFGKSGQVAQALSHDLNLPNIDFVGSDVANFLEPQSVLKILNEIKPKLVINAAAHTAVDKAETEKSQAMQINGDTVGVIADWCFANQAQLIHFSTDYVFDGTGDHLILETQKTSPVNFYGETKLKGETLIQKSKAQAVILRVSWVYAPWGKNFPKTILRLTQEREELSIVADQIGSPTDAREISAFVNLIVDSKTETLKLPAGIYHLAFKDYMSWYDLAKATVKEAQKKGLPLKVKSILPITSDKFPTPARRPKNSRLATGSHEVKKYIEMVQARAHTEGWGYLD